VRFPRAFVKSEQGGKLDGLLLDGGGLFVGARGDLLAGPVSGRYDPDCDRHLRVSRQVNVVVFDESRDESQDGASYRADRGCLHGGGSAVHF
jgi:hypothetical protein